MGRLVIAVALSALVCLPSSAEAQTSQDQIDAIRKDIEELKAGQARLEKSLEELKAALRPRREGAVEPSKVTLTLGPGSVKGAATARVVLFDFTDYQ